MSGKRVKRKIPESRTDEKPTKEETAVAKYMKKHVPVKKTKFMYHVVEYFSGSRAVDILLESPWAKPAAENEQLKPTFTDRQSVVDFLDRMLQHKFFHRARKIAITERDLRRKQLKKLKKKEQEEKEKKRKKEDKRVEEDESGSNSEEEQTRGEEDKEGVSEKDTPKTSKKKKSSHSKSELDATPLRKRRIRLDMHLDQRFVDCTDAFVWIYSPMSFTYWLLGVGVLVLVVGLCLFPLWPSRLREAVYYLSLAAAGFLAFILALAVLRTVVFALIWLLTIGRHHLWLLPNLTEDVGFFASFWPLYQYEYRGPKSATKKDKKRRTKDKVSDDEGANVASQGKTAAASVARCDDTGVRQRHTGQSSADGQTLTVSSQTSDSGTKAEQLSDDKQTESGGGGVEGSNAESTSDEGSQHSGSCGSGFEMLENDEENE